VKVGQDVDELGLGVRGQHLLQLVHAHAVIVQRHRYELGAVDHPGLNGAQVCWPASDDLVTLVDKDLADQIQSLLRAVRQQHVVSFGRQLVLVHGFDQVVFKWGIAFGGSILED
jgi:hypothetical protein